VLIELAWLKRAQIGPIGSTLNRHPCPDLDICFCDCAPTPPPPPPPPEGQITRSRGVFEHSKSPR
jgi:hypothetical protein